MLLSIISVVVVSFSDDPMEVKDVTFVFELVVAGDDVIVVVVCDGDNVDVVVFCVLEDLDNVGEKVGLGVGGFVGVGGELKFLATITALSSCR